MARIASAADKMKQLLDELLELSRIGRTINPPENVSLSALAEEARELLRGPLEARGVRLEVQPDMPTVRGDRVRLREVLQNLIENATKFMGDEQRPVIRVSAALEHERVICEVRDNGIGIEPRYASKVFGLFEQLDQSQPGSGVGLALVQRIVAVHGGRTWAESPGLGCGASFYFELPAEAGGS
jgi:signal transduction histidine kinase